MSNVYGTLVHIRQNGGGWQYSTDNQMSFTFISFPCFVYNTDLSQICNVIFTTHLEISQLMGENKQITFIAGTDNIVFDGLYNGTICLITNYFNFREKYALFRNGYGGGESIITPGKNNVIIKNFKYINLASNHEYQYEEGPFLAGYFACGTHGNEIHNLENLSSVTEGKYGGCIAGYYTGLECNGFVAKNIVNRSDMGNTGYTFNMSGVFPQGSFSKSTGTLIFQDLINYGSFTISSVVGGIFSLECFTDSTSNVFVDRCVNFGNLTNNRQGGIFGAFCFNRFSGSFNITNCYNSGDAITAGIINLGGILGYNCFQFSSLTAGPNSIRNCYNTGDLSVCQDSGGIFGKGCFRSASNNSGVSLVIENCFNTSLLSDGTLTYGISANEFGWNMTGMNNGILLNNCYNVSNNNNYNNIFGTHGFPYVDIGTVAPFQSFGQQQWNSSVAVNYLKNVAWSENQYLSWFSNQNIDWVDVAVGGSTSEPFILHSFSNNYYQNTNVFAGTNVTPTLPSNITQADYIYVTSSASQPYTVSSVTAQGVIITNPDLNPQIDITVAIFQKNIFDGNFFTNLYNLNVFQSDISAVCCLGYSLIRVICDGQLIEKRIEKVCVGDVIYVGDNRGLPVKYVFSQRINNVRSQNKKKDQIYVLPRSSYAELTEDLVLTGGHPILVDDYQSVVERERHNIIWRDPAERKIGDKTRLLTFINEKAKLFENYGEFTVYNVVLDTPNENEMIWLNGILTESLSEKLYDQMRRLNN
jgi:hypothetical protein